MPSVPPGETRAELPEPGAQPSPPTLPEPPEPDDIPPWPAWTAPAAIAAGFGLWLIVGILVGIGAKAGGSSLAHPSPAVSLIGNLLSDASFVARGAYFARLAGRPRPPMFGYRPGPLGNRDRRGCSRRDRVLRDHRDLRLAPAFPREREAAEGAWRGKEHGGADRRQHLCLRRRPDR